MSYRDNIQIHRSEVVILSYSTSMYNEFVQVALVGDIE